MTRLAGTRQATDAGPSRWRQWLVSKLPRRRERAYRPAFDRPRLVQRLQHADAGAASEALRARSAPRFFFDPADGARLRAAYRRAGPGWEQAAAASADAALGSGYRVYARKGPPLGRDYPWGSLSPGPGSDRLYCKRPHRFAFFPELAKLALLGEREAPELMAILQGWREYAVSSDNALAYDSTLAVIQRLLALTWGWHLLCAREATVQGRAAFVREEAAVLEVIADDIDYLWPRLGDAYPNNHLLVDLFAAWFIATVWPELCPVRADPAATARAWLGQVERQVYADGASFEHSLHYHEYACEMLSAYLVLAERNGQAVVGWARERAERALRLQADLAGASGNALALGDTAEDMLFPLDAGKAWTPGAWREIGRQLFGWRIEAARDAQAVEKAFWMLGATLAPPDPDPAPEAAAVHSYPQGGYHVFEQPGGRERCLLRSGPPHGVEVAAGHMHTDWLSLYVALDGEPLIAASGTYSYRRRAAGDSANTGWRDYFRGPAAANSVQCPAHDPLGVAKGDFREAALSPRVTTGAPSSGPGLAWVEARLDATGPLNGQRRGVVQVAGNYWLVYDLLPETAREAGAESRLQLAHAVRVARSDGDSLVATGQGGAELGLAWHGWQLSAVREGDAAAPAGWVSPAYGDLQPAPQLIFAPAAKPGPGVLMLARGERGPWQVSARCRGNHLVAQVGGAGGRDLLVVALGTPGGEYRDGGRVFRGRMLWVRESGDELQVRWLDGERFEMPGLALSAVAPSAWLECRYAAGASQLAFDPASPVVVETASRGGAGEKDPGS